MQVFDKYLKEQGSGHKFFLNLFHIFGKLFLDFGRINLIHSLRKNTAFCKYSAIIFVIYVLFEKC